MTAEVSKAEIEVGEDCNEIKHVGDDPDGSYVFVSGDLVGKDVNVECVEGFRSDLDVKDGELKEIENKCVGDENDVVGVKVGKLGVENGEIVENCVGEEGDGNGVVEGEVGELGGENGVFPGVEAVVGESGVENEEIVNKGVENESDGNGVVGVEVGELGVENCVGDEGDGNGVVEGKVGELGGENGGFSGVEAVVGESGVENEEIVNKGVGHESDGNDVVVVKVGELGVNGGISGVEALVGESGVENREIVENCVGGENDVVGVKAGELGVENGEIGRSSVDVDVDEAADVVASNNDLEVQIGELGVANGEIVKSCVEGDDCDDVTNSELEGQIGELGVENDKVVKSCAEGNKGDVVTNNDLEGQVGELGVENDEVAKSCGEADDGDVVMNNDLEGKVGESGTENGEIVKSCVDGDDVTSNNDLEGQVRELGVGNGENVRSSVEEKDVIATDGVEVQVGEVGVENGEIVQSSVEDDVVNKDEVVEVKDGELGVENRVIVNDFIGDEGGGVETNDVEARPAELGAEDGEITRSMVDESNCVSDEADVTGKKCIGEEGDVVNSNDVEVKVGELGADNEEIVRSSVDGSSCVGDESDVTLSNSVEPVVGDLGVENGEPVQSSVVEDGIVTSNDIVEFEVGELGVENGEIVQSSVDSSHAVEVKVGELGVENGEIVQSDVEEKADVVTPSNDVEVKVGELGVENGEIVQSSVIERSCITDEADVVPENNDVEAPVGELNIENKGIVDEADVVTSTNDGADVVTSSKDLHVQVREMNPENDEIVHSSLDENNCIDDEANVVPEAPEEIVEEQNGAAILEPEPQQLDHEVKVEDQIELVSTPNAKENRESHVSVAVSGLDLGESQESGVISPEAGDSHEVTEKSEEKDNLDSNAEFGSSEKCQNMVSEPAEVKSEETLDSQMVTTKSIESEFDQLDNTQETHEVENNPTLVTDEPATDVKESPDSQSVNTISVESRSSQLDNKEEKVAEKIKTDLDNVGETCKDVVSGENTVLKGEVVGIDRSQKSPEISENSENADGLVEEQEVGIGSYLITENSRVSELDDTQCQTEVENLDVKNRESVEKLETEIQNDLVGGDSSVIREVVNVEKLNSVPEIVAVENGEDHVKGDEARDEKLESKDGVESNGDGTEGSVADTVDGQNPVAEAAVRPFHFLIRVPRFDDEKLKEEIRLARLQVDEKTRERDAIRMELPTRRANCQAYGEKFETARSEERAARRLVKLKRQEIDSVQSVISRVKNAVSVEEIDGRIYNMEHAIAHETLELKEEKQLIREIKQLKQLREQLASNMGSVDEMGQRDEIEERLKVLKKELERLKETVSKAEAISGAAGRKYDEESKKLREFQARFKAADAIRQDAYKQFHDLNKLMSDKSKHFWRYRDDSKTAGDLASGRNRNREGLHHHCVDQVERIMELWNKNDEFRADYVRCNIRSTLRRLRTYDGRSLGPDEEPPVIPSYTDDRVNASVANPVKANTVSIVPTPEQGTVQVSKQVLLPVKGEEAVGKKTEKVSERKNEVPKTKKPMKPSLVNGSVATVTGRVESEVTMEEEKRKEREEKVREKENKKTKELEELAKEEELRKKDNEEKLKEQRRLEEKVKAQEALERKKRNAEKAQVRAELRAQKEAEQKEKEREKRLKKKEKKKAGVSDPNDGNSDILTATSSENAIDTTKESSDSSGTTTAKRQLQQPKPGPSYFAKLSKPKASLPPPLRNRGKRRWQQYIWVITAALFCLCMFYLVNSNFFVTIRTEQKRRGF